MKEIILILCMTFSSLICQAQISQVSDMKEVFAAFDEADSKTLAIFDVDMVLIQPSEPAFQMTNMKRFSAICKRVMKEVPADKQMMFLSLMTISSHPILIDDRTPYFLDQLMQKGIPAMALTANLTGAFGPVKSMERCRVNALKLLGIDFAKSAPYQNPIVFDELASFRGHYSTYLDGVLFVNGTTVSKGEAFLAFLAKSEFCPNKVIFIDDKEDNLKSVETAIQTLDKSIDYLGLHYLGAQKYPSREISEEEFESKWEQLASQAKEF
jgi:hypothetical protein